MFNLKTWFSLALCIVGIYIFIYFEDFVINKDYVDGSFTTRNKGVRLIIYMLAQNKYGFWIVRCIPLIVGLAFGKAFIEGIRE